MNVLGTRMDMDESGFAMRMMCFYSPTDCTDEHGFYHAEEYVFGTRMDTDRLIYHADVYFILPQMARMNKSMSWRKE